MPTLQTCADCGGHVFVVLSGEWVVWGENRLQSPVVMLCVQCGRERLTATWTGTEQDKPAGPKPSEYGDVAPVNLQAERREDDAAE